jgi:hypothetical protein
MLKRFSILACAVALALVLIVAPAGAKKKASSKPAKAYWYATKKAYMTADFTAHVSVQKSNELDFLRVDGGCAFYRGAAIAGATKLKNNKLTVDTTINGYSPKDKVSTVISIKIDAKFKDGKFKGTYTISDPSSECTAAQKVKHSFSAKKRVKQTAG